MGGISTQIPENWNLPLFWATVDGSQAGNLTEQEPALLVGQYNAQGTAQTSAGTLTSSAVLTFGAGNVPVYVVPGMLVTDLTTPTAITGGQTVLSVQATTVTLSADVNVAVVTGDIINFAWPSNPGHSNGVVPNVAIPIGSVAQARALFGLGSMLERMVTAFFAVNTIQLLYVLPVPDPAAGVKSTGTIQILGAVTASGVLTLYIAGQVVAVTVHSTDTPSTIATNLAAAINAVPELPVTAVVDGSHAFQVDVTCRWFGLTGNDITIIPNYYGIVNGEALPAGISLDISAMASGTGEPTFTTAISNIQLQEFDYVGMPYTDAATMSAWANEYGFGSGGRWNFTRQQYGFVVNAVLGTPIRTRSRSVSPSMRRSSRRWSSSRWRRRRCGNGPPPIAVSPLSVSPTIRRGRCRRSNWSASCRRPCRTALLKHRLNNLTNGGFAIQRVAPDGNAMILREQTQYQFNSFGQGDTAFGLLTSISDFVRAVAPDELGDHQQISAHEARAGWHQTLARAGGSHADRCQGRTDRGVRRRGVRRPRGRSRGLPGKPRRPDRPGQPEQAASALASAARRTTETI